MPSVPAIARRLLVCLLHLPAAGLLCPPLANGAPPRVHDPRLVLELFAEAPQIVTPVGVTLDAQGRLLVIESHTHFRPEGYTGPAADRIRAFEDTDGDGRADRFTTFYEGTRHTMNLAACRDGSVYVATRRAIFRLRDTDGDGRADQRTELAELDTPGDYPHNGLSGFAFDFTGDVYFGFGENLGAAYRLIGSDGTTLSGGGEGGNLYRCRPDGSGLARVATGFWNPFHLCFDAFGRLFAVDNDPDSRPPCRLLHIVDQGDYGYRFRNGRKGLHPFTAWNGELPGTLPMVAGTGEAPSGIVAYESDQFPADYLGQLLVTSWGDHRLERYRLEPRGASFTAQMTPVVSGGEDFRPVGIAVAADGSVYFSDWVDRAYELHGQGRIWRLRAQAPPPRIAPSDAEAGLRHPDRPLRENAARQLASHDRGRTRLAAILTDDASPRAATEAYLALRRVTPAGQSLAAALASPSPEVRALAARLEPLGDWMRLAAKDPDPYVRAAATARLPVGSHPPLLQERLGDDDPFVVTAALAACGAQAFDLPLPEPPNRARATSVLALRRSLDPAARQRLPQLLVDPDPNVRLVAIQWIGEEQLVELRAALEAALPQHVETRQLFEAALAALERLDTPLRDNSDEWSGQQYVESLLRRTDLPNTVIQAALRVWKPHNTDMNVSLLRLYLGHEEPAIRRESLLALRESELPQRSEMLLAFVARSDVTDDERADALAGLDGAVAEVRAPLVDLAVTAPAVVALEALRALRGAMLDGPQQARLTAAADPQTPAWRELAARIAAPLVVGETAERVDRANQAAAEPGDPAVGRRVFFHRRLPGCYRCHESEGRGAAIGPNLTGIGRTTTAPRLAESLADPSREIAPLFVPWVLATDDGRTRTGLLVGHELDGQQVYVDERGEPFRLRPETITERRAHPRSIMPDGLVDQLTSRELRDLIAYLSASR